MPNIRQVTMEFSLEVLSECGFPLALLGKARSLRFLRQDTWGFQVSFKVQPARISPFKKKLKEQYEAVTGIQPLYPSDKDGLETLLIRGRWLRKTSVHRRDEAAKTLRSLSSCQAYFLRSPEVVGEKLRVSIGREQSKIEQMLAKFDKLKVPYHVAKPAELRPEG